MTMNIGFVLFVALSKVRGLKTKFERKYAQDNYNVLK